LKKAITKIQIESKFPGDPKMFKHRPGIACSVERNKSNPGQFIIWFGKKYALVDAVKLEDTVFFLS
jgi:hypothetical protein